MWVGEKVGEDGCWEVKCSGCSTLTLIVRACTGLARE